MIKFRSEAVIDYAGQGTSIVHAHVILVLEALDLRERHTLCNRIMPLIHRVVHLWDRLGCVAHGKRVHRRAQTNKLDGRIAIGSVLKVTYFYGV